MASQTRTLYTAWTPAGDASCIVTYDDAQGNLMTSVAITCPQGTLTVGLTTKSTGRTFTRSFTGPLSPATQTFDVHAAGILLDNIGHSASATLTASFGWGP